MRLSRKLQKQLEEVELVFVTRAVLLEVSYSLVQQVLVKPNLQKRLQRHCSTMKIKSFVLI